jgi:hypothetical protein
VALPDPTAVSGPVGQRLAVPTPQDPVDGQAVHPSVLHIPGGWSGYPYWMGMTPYLDGDDEYEDPCVLASLDGVTWVVPSSSAFPLDDQPGSPGAYNSDIDLAMGPDDTMFAFWRTFDPAAVGAEEKLYYSSSTDGVVWSAKTQLYSSDMTVRRLLSPAFLYEGGAWRMWAVDVVPSPNQVVRLQGGALPTDAWAAPVAVDVGTMQTGKEPWHLDVISTADGYVGLLNDCTLNASGTGGDLLFIASSDGLTWTNSGTSVIPRVQHGEHDALYRASLVPDNIGSLTGWRVWYSAWQTTSPPIWHIYRTWLVDRQAPPALEVADVADLVRGSHRIEVQAVVCETFQSGDDPTGVVISISGGDVQFDATADVWSTMQATTPGVDEATGESRFPRRGGLLAPYGNELFLRYGVHTGPSVLWVPLGYYRINATEQAGTARSPITLTGTDRMQGLIDARLTEPRQYGRFETVAAVVFDLVLEVYPDAIILWDDNTAQLPIGRDLIVEEHRYAALRDLADSWGKVCYWDSEGFLRFETAPDPTQVAWEINAGRNGVLVTSKRRVSRDGMYNAVVARGEGATEAPATGIAVDTGPNSPTNWNGRFGKVPRFYSSPLIYTDDQAKAAATAMLQRTLGMPYSVDFGAVPNPALRPRVAVRVQQVDGNREVHLVDTLTLHLTGQAMTGTTREQTLTSITAS